jgi:hypothetical protein
MKLAEEDYFTCFKKLRNKLKKYSRNEVFDACMENIVKFWGMNLTDITKENNPTPINLFLLMKWGACYAEHPKNSKKTFELKDFQELYAAIVDLPANVGILKSGGPFALSKFIRACAPPQLYYQIETGLYGLAVLETIINGIGIPYDVDRTMIKAIGLPVREFIDLQLSVLKMMTIQEKYPSYQIDFYKNLYKTYTKEHIQIFLNCMSNDYSTLHEFMMKDHKVVGNPEFEQALFTPLYRKPLFNRFGTYFPYHKALLDANIEYGVYDILRKEDAPSFCSAFGEGFENYVNKGITLAGMSYLRESDIRRLTHKDRSCDFLIPGDDAAVLVEAKSAEMHYLTRLDPQPDYLRKTLQNSLISGYQQIFVTTQYLKDTKNDLVQGKELFGVIITYKNLMLGHPDEIWEEFMRNFMEVNLPATIFNSLPVSPNKIFVVSSLEFDYLLCYCRQKSVSLFDCLRKIEQNNSESKNKKLFVYDNFDIPLKILDIPQLSISIENITMRIGEALKNVQGAG